MQNDYLSHRPTVVIDAGSYSIADGAIAGVGLRLVEVARALSRRYSVQVVAEATNNSVDLDGARHVVSGDEANQAIATADAVMFFDTPDRRRIETAVDSRALIVSECRAPLEHMSYPSVTGRVDPIAEYQKFLGPYRRLLEVSHHFICRSQAERSALVSTLCTVGRITPDDIARSATLNHLVTTVPVGFGQWGLEMADASPSVHIADFLWTGGIWSFFQPLMFVEAMAILRDRGVDATAAFLHAEPTEDTRHVIDHLNRTIDSLGLKEIVHLQANRLMQSDRERHVKAALAYVCIASPGVENETGTRLRLRDTWLHGIPTIIDPWGISAEVVRRERLGLVLPAPSAESLADALQQVKLGEVNMPGRRIERLYEDSLSPLVDWLDSRFARTR